MKKRSVVAFVLSLLVCILFSAPAQAATATKYTITVTFSKVKVVSNKSVGNSWSHVVTAMGKSLTSGKSYKLIKKSTDSFNIVMTSTEKDSKPDIGTSTLPVKVSSLQTGTTTFISTVTVVENSGRYKGNKAVWVYTVVVKKAKA